MGTSGNLTNNPDGKELHGASFQYLKALHPDVNQVTYSVFSIGCNIYADLFYYLVYITELRNIHQTSQQPVTDDETTLHKFCVKLETALRHEQKGKSLDS